jgi:prepilin-type N-terminal cleavage/methylation domain-containing protein
MMNKLQKHKNQTGFTIIEVLIVLAIAGLIMVIVFLAVPNLERSQRNSARKSDASHIASAVADYVSNNNGTLPGGLTTDATTIFNDAGGKSGLSQFGDLIPNTSATITAGDFTVDPTASAWTGPNETSDTAVLLVPPTTGATSGWVCQGATPQYSGTPRNAVLMYTVESGGSSWTWDCVTAQ